MPAMAGLTRISNVLSTIKLSGLNLIHAGKAVILASRPGAARVLEIAAEAFAPVAKEVAVPVLEIAAEAVVPVVDAIAEVAVPVLEVVEEVAPAVNVIAEATVSVVEPVSESLAAAAKAADPVINVATNITGPIIEVVQEIVSPLRLPHCRDRQRVPQAAYPSVPISVLSDGFALDKDLLRVATFQAFVNGFAQQNGLSHSATKELCNSFITGLVPTVVTPAPPPVSYEDISLDTQLYLWARFGSMLRAYRKKNQLSHQDLVDLLNIYVTRDFRKFWERSESTDGLSGSGEPNGSESTVELPRVEGNSSGNTILEFSLSPVESYTPAVEVVNDDEADENDEEPPADLDLVDGSSPDNTVLEPSLSPVENITAVEVVDEEPQSTTPPISPCTTLNTPKTILEDPDEEEEPQESSIPSSPSDNLSDTTAHATPTPAERNDHEGQETLPSEAILWADAQSEDEDVAEFVEGMRGSLEELVQTPDSPSWKVVGQKGKGKATAPTSSLGLGASIWAKQQPSGSSLGFVNLECAEGESDRDDETGNKDEVELDADEEREERVADAENQGSRKGKSRSRGHSWWMNRKPQENRGKVGWERREAKRAREATKQVNAEASTSGSRNH
ncbi:hypothetical protein H1R20_g358, partial [Candolleomyces eurysporus]